jgi:flagellar hook-associated protein 1
MTINSILYTARDALQAQTYGVTVTGQNINNANTPGYVRRDPLLATRVMGQESYGSVEALGLRRATDSYLEGRYLSSVGMSAAAKTRDSALAQVEGLFQDLAGAGIGDSLDGMRSAFNQLAVDPSDTIGRNQVVGALSDFVSRVNDTGQALAAQRNELLSQATDSVGQINDHAKELAKLNEQIVNAKLAGNDAADLLDKRGQVLMKLADLVDVRVVEEPSGNALVQVAGATLVEGNTARQLGVDVDANGAMKLTASRIGADNPTDITRGLSGGSLASVFQVRDSDIAQVAQKLDTFVYDFATALNQQHRAGYGLDGSTGLDLFDLSNVTSPPAGTSLSIKLNAQITANPDRLAASDLSTTLPGSGVNARLLSGVFDASAIFGGTRNVGDAYSDLIGDVGVRRASATSESSLRQTMEDQAYQLRESSMGVSLDDEMIALTRYQRAYQAASKLLGTADELFQDLLGIL